MASQGTRARRCGSDFGVHQHQGQQHIIHIPPRIFRAGCCRHPAWARDSITDDTAKPVDAGFDVRLEQAGVDLREHVADGFALAGQFDGEGGLEVRDEVRDYVGAQVGEVGEGEEDAGVLQ